MAAAAKVKFTVEVVKDFTNDTYTLPTRIINPQTLEAAGSHYKGQSSKVQSGYLS